MCGEFFQEAKYESDEVVEVVSTSTSEEVGQDSDNGLDANNSGSDYRYGDEEMMVQGLGGDDTNKKKIHGRDRILTVHEIDAHWLQRQLSGHYNEDADACANIAGDVLNVLNPTKNTDLRQCENCLLVLLESELFDLIKLILNNRVKIWGCVSLKRVSNITERDSVEAVLKSEATGEGMKVWEEIHSKGKTEDWTRERIRGITDSLRGGGAGVGGVEERMCDNGMEKRQGVSSALDSIGNKPTDSDKHGVCDATMNDVYVNKEEVIELDLNSLTNHGGQ